MLQFYKTSANEYYLTNSKNNYTVFLGKHIHKHIKFPPNMIGKRVRFKVEFVDDCDKECTFKLDDLYEK